MVFYYTTVDPSYVVYVGRDKHENEDLIKHGWDNDVWFHVDKDGETIESIPEKVLADCMQLVKHNSIEGNKISNVGVVYTYWRNLKKTGDMQVGQVGYHNPREVRHAVVEKRSNEIVNRLNKTKREAYPNLAQEKADRIKALNRIAREAARKKALEEKALRQKRLEEREARSYDKIHKSANMMSNKDLRQDHESFEDDFM